MSENPIKSEVTVFAQTDFRNQKRRFGIKLDDRRRHVYLIGKTGMGKTTMLENMVLSDIYNGHGIALIDPHGDSAEKIIDYIPNERINDVVYFNPSDADYPIGFNILELKNESHRHLIASGLMSVFKKIWIDMWSSRMEYILNNTILALLENPGTTLLGINRLLADPVYRKKIIVNVTDPVVKAFWLTEFANYNDRYQQEAVAPIQNKIGQFLSGSIMRNIVAQVKSTIDIRKIMDERKIFIINLSKGRVGEDASRLLGGMLVTKLQLSAMERVDIPEEDRKDFFLYVDEFQNFATDSFANILSEARKYRLGLVMAHQYIEQLEETVASAVFGNVGTIIAYRVGAKDAEFLAKEFDPVFTEQDIVNLPKFHVYMRLMIDGVASKPFSASGLPPIGSSTASADKVIKVTRERYATPRAQIEEKILEWSGMAEVDVEEFLSAKESGGKKKASRVKEADIPDEQRHPYKTHCWRCLNETDVPFPPDGKRPTYCRDCYPDAMKDRQEGKPPPSVPQQVLDALKEQKEALKQGKKAIEKREPKKEIQDTKNSKKPTEAAEPLSTGEKKKKKTPPTKEKEQKRQLPDTTEPVESPAPTEPDVTLETLQPNATDDETESPSSEEKKKRKRRRRKRKKKEEVGSPKKEKVQSEQPAEAAPASPQPVQNAVQNTQQEDTSAKPLKAGDVVTFE